MQVLAGDDFENKWQLSPKLQCFINFGNLSVKQKIEIFLRFSFSQFFKFSIEFYHLKFCFTTFIELSEHSKY